MAAVLTAAAIAWPQGSRAAQVLAELPAGGVAASIGVPNSGKTTIVQEALDAAPWGARAVVFDPYAIVDRAAFNRRATHKRPWWPRCPVLTVDELLRRPSLLDKRAVRIVVAGTRGTLDQAQLGRDFSSLCQLLQLTHGVAVVAEEAGLYSRFATQWINTVSTGGGHFGMRIVLLAQRIGRIQKDAREGITLVVAGAQGAPEDITDLRSRCGADFANAVQALRPPTNGKPVDLPIAWRLGEGVFRGAPRT